MPIQQERLIRILMIVTPNFNMAATVGFLDPFRVLNYLQGRPLFRWTIASTHGGDCLASNGMLCRTERLTDIKNERYDFVIVSSSWAPEASIGKALQNALRHWARSGTTIGALDTGSFILAASGLLKGKRATVHYEHIDALIELFPETDVSEDIYVFDGNRITCSGGIASVDFALQIVHEICGAALANASARYIFHQSLRPHGSSQNPLSAEPVGGIAPSSVRAAIQIMEEHLEDPISIPEICERINVSQRQLGRLFTRYVKRPPALYYRDIRLDRARGLVTQTELPMSEVAIAAGFASQVHFSRAYRERFGLTPRSDRIEGRVPFEFRAWPMHRNTD